MASASAQAQRTGIENGYLSLPRQTVDRGWDIKLLFALALKKLGGVAGHLRGICRGSWPEAAVFASHFCRSNTDAFALPYYRSIVTLIKQSTELGGRTGVY